MIEIQIETPEVSLAVRDSEGEGEPIVLLHGGPGVPDYLAPVANLLTPEYRTIRFDQRGVGESKMSYGGFELEDYVRDIEAIRAHFGYDSWHVFGHSWGGLLAQVYLLHHPRRLRSVFLCNPAPGVGDEWRRDERAAVVHALKRAGPLGSAALGLWGLLKGISGRRSVRPTRETTDAVRRLPAKMLDQVSADLPVLVVYGRKDVHSDAIDIVRARFPRARHVVIEEAAHLPWLQAPERFREVLAQFYEISRSRSA